MDQQRIRAAVLATEESSAEAFVRTVSDGGTAVHNGFEIVFSEVLRDTQGKEEDAYEPCSEA